MTDRVRPAVKALIEDEGKLLVLKVETGKDFYWILPGGKVEYGEHPLDALDRELKEELSVEAEISSPVGMYHFFVGPENKGDEIVLTVFKADIGDQEINISSNPANENITEYRWMKPNELIEKTSNDNLADLIRKYQN